MPRIDLQSKSGCVAHLLHLGMYNDIEVKKNKAYMFINAKKPKTQQQIDAKKAARPMGF